MARDISPLKMDMALSMRSLGFVGFFFDLLAALINRNSHSFLKSVGEQMVVTDFMTDLMSYVDEPWELEEKELPLILW